MSTSSPSSAAQDPSFYDACQVHMPAAFIALVGFRTLVGTFGLWLNVALVFTTLRSKKLRSRCNVLIGFEALCCAVTSLHNFVTFFVVVTGTSSFLELHTCFWLQLVPTFGINLLLIAMLAVGIDRLVSVAAPFWVRHQNPKVYVGSLLFCCFLYAAYAIWRLYPASFLDSPNLMVLCSLNDLYQGQVATELFRNCMLITGATIVCYVAIWVVINVRKSVDAESQVNLTRRLFKSLAVNVTFVAVGYFLNAGFLILLEYVPMSQVRIVYATYGLGMFTNLATASNAPALYLFSTEYRKAFNEVFWRTNSVVSPLPIGEAQRAAQTKWAKSAVKKVERTPVEVLPKAKNEGNARRIQNFD